MLTVTSTLTSLLEMRHCFRFSKMIPILIDPCEMPLILLLLLFQGLGVRR